MRIGRLHDAGRAEPQRREAVGLHEASRVPCATTPLPSRSACTPLDAVAAMAGSLLGVVPRRSRVVVEEDVASAQASSAAASEGTASVRSSPSRRGGTLRAHENSSCAPRGPAGSAIATTRTGCPPRKPCRAARCRRDPFVDAHDFQVPVRRAKHRLRRVRTKSRWCTISDDPEGHRQLTSFVSRLRNPSAELPAAPRFRDVRLAGDLAHRFPNSRRAVCASMNV